MPVFDEKFNPKFKNKNNLMYLSKMIKILKGKIKYYQYKIWNYRFSIFDLLVINEHTVNYYWEFFKSKHEPETLQTLRRANYRGRQV